jgi:AbrB family looped-hinge helix DNA binding protein
MKGDTSVNTCGEDACCRIDAIVTMDAKGQIVLPKDLREKANLKANDKIAVVACEKDGVVCCIMMVKAESFRSALSETLGPLIKDVIKEEKKK